MHGANMKITCYLYQARQTREDILRAAESVFRTV